MIWPKSIVPINNRLLEQWALGHKKHTDADLSNKMAAPQMTQVAPQNNQRTAEVQNQVDEVIGIMHTNIDKVVQRGEKLDSLQNKTDELQQGALSFKKTSNQVASAMWWKNAKLTIIIAGIVTTVIVIAVVSTVKYQ